MKLKLKKDHPYRRRMYIRRRVRILRKVDDEYGTKVSFENLLSAELDLKLAVKERWI